VEPFDAVHVPEATPLPTEPMNVIDTRPPAPVPERCASEPTEPVPLNVVCQKVLVALSFTDIEGSMSITIEPLSFPEYVPEYVPASESGFVYVEPEHPHRTVAMTDERRSFISTPSAAG
jgi:hypothetical protein